MQDTKAFEPMYGPSAGSGTGGLLPSVTVSASAANAFSAQFPGTLYLNEFVAIRIANKTTAWAHVNFGIVGSIAAASVATSMPIAPGAVEVVTVSSEVSGAAVILDAAPGTQTAVIFTRGVGV